MYPDNDPNDLWWQQSDFTGAEDIPVSSPPNSPPVVYTNGFDPSLPTTLDRGTEIEMANIVFDQANRKYGNLIYADGAFWVYKKPIWERVQEASMRKACHQFDYAVVNNKPVKIKSATISGIIKELAAISHAPEFFYEPAEGINCRNGTVKVDSNGVAKLHPHDPNDRHRFTIDADYDPSIKKLPPESLVYKLLDGVFKGDEDRKEKGNVISEILGAASFGMATRVKQPKGFIFYGETANNGKSTVAGLLELLLPENAVSHIPMAKFSDDARIVNLAGKAANVVEELSSASISSEAYKAAVTGDKIEGRDLYVSALTFRPRALHIATTNILPTFSDGIDRGLQRRLFVLNFNRVIPSGEIIPDILEQIRNNEMSILVHLAVHGAKRLAVNKDYTVPPSSKTQMQEWLMQDPVYSWFTEKFTIVSDPVNHPWFLLNDLYDDFNGWCEKERIKERFVLSKERFSRKVGMIKGVYKRRLSHKREVRGFIRAPYVP